MMQIPALAQVSEELEKLLEKENLKLEKPEVEAQDHPNQRI